MATQFSKKRKFVADSGFKAELKEFLSREQEDGSYSPGLRSVYAPNRTQNLIMATRTENVLGEKGRRIGELTFCCPEENKFKRPRKLLRCMLRRY